MCNNWENNTIYKSFYDSYLHFILCLSSTSVNHKIILKIPLYLCIRKKNLNKIHSNRFLLKIARRLNPSITRTTRKENVENQLLKSDAMEMETVTKKFEIDEHWRIVLQSYSDWIRWSLSVSAQWNKENESQKIIEASVRLLLSTLNSINFFYFKSNFERLIFLFSRFNFILHHRRHRFL